MTSHSRQLTDELVRRSESLIAAAKPIAGLDSRILHLDGVRIGYVSRTGRLSVSLKTGDDYTIIYMRHNRRAEPPPIGGPDLVEKALWILRRHMVLDDLADS